MLRNVSLLSLVAVLILGGSHLLQGEEPAATPAAAPAADAKREVTTPPELDLPYAKIDGNGPGWRVLGKDDLVNVNCDEDTWTFGDDGVIHCTGVPNGVLRTKDIVTNFELVIEWRHLARGGNSGVFVWTTPESVAKLERGKLPAGIETQILDNGYVEDWMARNEGKQPTGFSSHGDVFPVRVKMDVFKPTTPNGARSLPRKQLSRSTPEWNHYYIRGINGEVRLWVNGEEVSGGTNARPASGYISLESEGSPVEFRNFRIRELP